MLVLLCDSCNSKSSCLQEWYNHLISEDHQIRSRYLFRERIAPQKVLNRTIILFGFTQNMSSSEVINFFGIHGLVQDIFFKRALDDGRLKACIVLMDSAKETKRVIDDLELGRTSESTQIKMSVKHVELKSSFRKRHADVLKIFEDSPEEIFRYEHKMLVERCQELSMEQQFYEFVLATSLSREEVELRQAFIRELENILQPSLGCFLRVFGSFFTGTGDKQSDLDIFVDLEKVHDEMQLKELLKEVLGLLHSVNTGREQGAKKKKRIFSNLYPIYARVPIIRIVQEGTGLRADISFNSQHSIYNSKLMKFLIKYDPRVRPLIKFLRYWAKFHNLIGQSHSIKPYALTLMIVVLLNQKCILPNVMYLQQLEDKKPQFVDEWNVAFHEDVEYIRKEVALTGLAPVSLEFYEKSLNWFDILELAKDFFQMFGDKNYKNCVICPYFGSIIPKSAFQNQEDFDSIGFPASFERIGTIVHKEYSMCVQDPFLLHENKTVNVNETVVKKFRELCTSSMHFISTVLDPCAVNPRLFNIFSNQSGKHNGDTEAKSNIVKQVFRPQLPDPQRAGPVWSENAIIVKSESIDFEPEDVPMMMCIPDKSVHSWSFSLEPTEDFIELFKGAFAPYGEPSEVESRMRFVWNNFVNDFFLVIFRKGFKLQDSIKGIGYFRDKSEEFEINSQLPYSLFVEHIEESVKTVSITSFVNRSQNQGPLITRPISRKRKRQNSSTVVGPVIKKLKEETFETHASSSETEIQSNEQLSSNEIPTLYISFTFPVQCEGMKIRYNKLPTGARKRFAKMVKVRGSYAAFMRRECLHFNQTLQIENQSSEKHVLILNPVAAEAKTTDLLIQTNESQTGANQSVNFKCSLCVDTATPTAYVYFHEKNAYLSPIPAIEVLRKYGFPLILQQYLMFRLYKLLFK